MPRPHVPRCLLLTIIECARAWVSHDQVKVTTITNPDAEHLDHPWYDPAEEPRWLPPAGWEDGKHGQWWLTWTGTVIVPRRLSGSKVTVVAGDSGISRRQFGGHTFPRNMRWTTFRRPEYVRKMVGVPYSISYLPLMFPNMHQENHSGPEGVRGCANAR